MAGGQRILVAASPNPDLHVRRAPRWSVCVVYTMMTGATLLTIGAVAAGRSMTYFKGLGPRFHDKHI